MIRSLIKLVVLIAIGVLVYNFFFGTETEKQASKDVFRKGGELVTSVFGIVKNEGEKFKAGKYDDALEKVGGLFDDLKDKAEEIDEKYVDRIAELDRKRRELERDLSELTPDQYDETQTNTEFTPKGDTKREVRNFERELEDLMKDTQDLIQQMKE